MHELYSLIFILKSRLNPKQIAERKHAANVRWGHEQADPKRGATKAVAKLANPIEQAIAKILPKVSILDVGDEGFLLTDGELYKVPRNRGHGDIAKMAIEAVGDTTTTFVHAVNKVIRAGAIRISTGEHGRREFSFELAEKPTTQQAKTLLEMSQAFEYVSADRLWPDDLHADSDSLRLINQANPRNAVPTFLRLHFKSRADIGGRHNYPKSRRSFYHGTSVAVAEQVAKEGLVPQNNPEIWGTQTEKHAHTYGFHASAFDKANGDTHAVIEFQPSARGTQAGSDHNSGGWYWMGGIPKRDIKRIRVYSHKFSMTKTGDERVTNIKYVRDIPIT